MLMSYILTYSTIILVNANLEEQVQMPYCIQREIHQTYALV